MESVDYDKLKDKLTKKNQIEILKNSSARNFEYYTDLFSNSSIELEKNTVLYDSFLGKSMTDNPYAMFLEIMDRDIDSEIKHVWVLKPEISEQIKRFWSMGNVFFVTPYSFEHIEYLVKAKYIVTNVSMPYYYQKRSGQVLMNTWHGTPIKGMGKYMGGQYGQWDNVMRSFLMSDYIISPNKYTTDIIADSYDLNGIYDGKILEIGYPRIDLIKSTDKQTMIDFLSQNNIKINPDKKTLLYAPTWRGQDANRKDMTEEFKQNVNLIKESLPDGWQLLAKAHQLVYDKISKEKELADILIANSVDTSELLSVVDGLVTDYSSILFDYYITGKPVILWAYDLDEYKADRGLLLDLDKLPGILATTETVLINSLNQLDNIAIERQLTNKFVEYQNNDSSKIAVDILFGNTKNYQDRITNIKSTKINKLIYVDGLDQIDAQEKINYINSQDFNKYNVIILSRTKPTQITANALKSISSHAKQIFRVGRTAVTQNEFADFVIANQYELTPEIIDGVRQVFEREFKRIVPVEKIDIIEYLGNQDGFFLNLIGLSNSVKKFVFKSTDFLRTRENAAKTDYNIFLETVLKQYQEIKIDASPIGEIVRNEQVYKLVPIGKGDYLLINQAEENVFLTIDTSSSINILNFGKINQSNNKKTNLFLSTKDKILISKLHSVMPELSITNLIDYPVFQKYLLQTVDRVVVI
ncbi:hypothetical protein FD956_02640 [Leuconostoc carnosum]|uniref:Truncated glycosyltransferase n=2 Tax=Leuconostoc carnosum TaxID=1252 RepID=K0D9E7_LEUCJ|nr:CDP-glycerol glycerophosphotransferase family protein [Leuconostoc carnosum]AFT81450.1 truncated glycosyltransferase [Leuconostoc carnosum JB16]KAA8330258.1 hypothetical protein FE409_02690 [Leuconostoc carnosum]KAA8381197.1 hypothetical protein FD956_02640 [Leuconostoc carnosum]QEA33012.1 hypothetical protein FGL89_02060 [Leuconostoc carnosum]